MFRVCTIAALLLSASLHGCSCRDREPHTPCGRGAACPPCFRCDERARYCFFDPHRCPIDPAEGAAHDAAQDVAGVHDSGADGATHDAAGLHEGGADDAALDAAHDAAHDAAAAHDSGAPPPIAWGEYATQLGAPACEGNALVVDTTGVELDSGNTIDDPSAAGEHLSLTEALWIAANRPGRDAIVFDAQVFDPSAPQSIPLDATVPLPMALSELCVDGRGRGVVVDLRGRYQALVLGPDALWVGLTVLASSQGLELYGAQVAACRLGTDGWARLGDGHVELKGQAVLGPGNVVASRSAVRVDDGTTVVHDNAFGFDPLTGRAVELLNVFDIRAGADLDLRVEGNTFAVQGQIFDVPYQRANADVVFRGNRVGVDPLGQPLPEPAQGVGVLEHLRYVIGPSNTISHTDTALVVKGTNNAPPLVHVTRNSITGNARDIVFEGVTPPPPPTIEQVSLDRASGLCPGEGVVEVFADPGDQGGEFLGEAACEPDLGWALEREGIGLVGVNVTATFTGLDLRTSTFSLPFTSP